VKDHYGCPVQATANVLAGKWKVLILWHLSFGPMRFAQLHGVLRDSSEKVLAAQLKQLQADGILDRVVTPTIPARVDYSLTAAGEDLIAAMQGLYNFGTKHLGVPPNMPRPP